MKKRIYLVDDEQPMLEGLSVSIKKSFPDLEICGMAKSGREALEGISRTKPDIVILDVRMPGMSGLDILRELRQILPEGIVILLTAYERFDIAQEAYSLGAYKYLVKPLSQELLAETIRGALSQHKVIEEAALRNLESMEKLEFARPLIETGFLYSLIMGNTDPELIHAYADWLGLSKDHSLTGHFAVVYKENAGLYRVTWFSGEELKRIRQEITNRLDCVIGPVMGRIIPVFTANEKTAQTGAAMEEAIRALEISGIKFALGPVEPLARLRNSWIKLSGEIAYEKDHAHSPDTSGRQDRSLLEYIQEIIDLAASGDITALKAAFTRWISLDGKNPDHLFERSLVAAVAAAFAGGNAEEILLAAKNQRSLDLPPNLDAAGEASQTLASSISSIMDKEQYGPVKTKMDARILKILNFINGSFNRQISLEDAAEKVGLSPAHVSRLLVSETGSSFTDHLSKKRIETACRELSEGILSIKEISSLCGYPDSNYFSRAFKKSMGVTPSEYKAPRKTRQGF